MGAAFVALAQAAPPAAEPASAPPLEEIKGELKVLKGGSNPDLAGLSSGPKLFVPGFTAPKDDSGPPAAPRGTPDSREKKKSTNANWLLDAMALQTKTGSGKHPDTDGRGQDALPVVDLADPAYLLKLYLAQRPEDQTAAPATARLEDPGDIGQTEIGILDEFLKAWISPRDQALLRPGGASSTGFSDTWPAPTTVPEVASMTTFPRADAPNPFIEALQSDLPPPDPTGAAPPVHQPFMLPPAAPPSENPTPAAIPSPVPSDAPVPVTRKPPPNPTDDKKYFPQLDRF